MKSLCIRMKSSRGMCNVSHFVNPTNFWKNNKSYFKRWFLFGCNAKSSWLQKKKRLDQQLLYVSVLLWLATAYQHLPFSKSARTTWPVWKYLFFNQANNFYNLVLPTNLSGCLFAPFSRPFDGGQFSFDMWRLSLDAVSRPKRQFYLSGPAGGVPQLNVAYEKQPRWP